MFFYSQTIFSYVAVFWFSYASLSKGVIIPSSFVKPFYAEPGDNVTIAWTYDTNVWTRIWSFRSDSQSSFQGLTKISDDGDPRLYDNVSFTNFEIIKPATLLIKKVNMDNNGEYEFEIETRSGSKLSSRVDVIIIEQPIASVGCSSPLVVNEGENISCWCNSTGGNPPPNASWYKDGTMVNGKGDLKKNLTLTNVSKYDSGNYTCRVQSYNLTDEEYVNITVLFKPIIESFTKTATYEEQNCVVENSTVVFTCKVDAYPTATITILHKGNNVSSLNGDVEVYTISSVNPGHSGTYQCVAVNRIGTTTSHSITLKVAEKPTAVIQCSNEITINEGDFVSCVCNSTGGVPTPKAWWIKDGTTVSGHNNVSNILNKKMSRNDSGTYTCKVESIPSLSDQTSIQISIYYEPSVISFESNINDTVFLGISVVLSCQADGYPSPTFSLYQNGSREILINVSAIMYTIYDARYSDAGEYKCVASNHLGSGMKTFKLEVEGVDTKAKTQADGDGGTEWYISLITFLCGLLLGLAIGAVATFFILKRRHRGTKQQNKPTDGVISLPQADTGNPSVYQELDLKDMDKGDNYQALNKNARSTGKRNEALEENEGAYQGLSDARGRNDDNYQSLQKV